MKQIKQVIHEECKNCENLRTISVYMDGSGYYACGCTPNHVEENRHKSPCNRFINCNDYFVIVEKEVPYPKFVGEHYAYSVSCAKHFNTKEEALNKTKDNNNYVFNIALNYGSRQELVKATKEIATLVKENKLDINDINEQTISDHLYTYNLPPIDLMIRTSGEQRLSNYLLYQLAYSEFIFTPTYWPDFTKDKFEECLKEYATRDRRYGKIVEE